MIYSRFSEEDFERKELLVDHATTVAELCEKDSSVFGVPSLGRLVGLVHDVGKASTAWQNYLFSDEKEEKIPHAPVGAKMLYEILHEFPDDNWMRYTAEVAALVIWGHHSGLSDVIAPDATSSYKSRLAEPLDHDQKEAVERFFQQIAAKEEIIRLIRAAGSEFKALFSRFSEQCRGDHYLETGQVVQLRMKEKRSFLMGLLVRMLYSSLRDNDSYASAAWEREEQTKTYKTASSLWTEMAANLDSRIAGFKDSEIGRARRQISDECLQNVKTFANESGVYRLNVVTGGGKTLTVTRSALYLAERFSKDHIYYVAPFTTILDQTARELRKALKRDDLILEFHSNLVGDKEDEDASGDKERASLAWKEAQRAKYAERWDIPFILTSQVQFFNALFAGQRQAAIRAHHLCNSVLIFDEVQSIPVKCISMFNVAVNFLADFCGCVVILCSATQPTFEAVKRPLRLSQPADLVHDVKKRFPVFERVKIVDMTEDQEFDAESLGTFITKLLNEHDGVQSVLIILNTKKAVRDVYDSVLAQGMDKTTVFHLSTNMCGAHIVEILDKVKKRLNERLPVVCVSTNLIEAGVDISFDTVIRSLTGLDRLAQSAGRCNRHKYVTLGNVYLVKYAENGANSISGLGQMQMSMKRVLADLRISGENDYFTEGTLKNYYIYYLYEVKKQFDYPDPDTYRKTLFDYLALNQNATLEYVSSHNWEDKGILHQAFRTAGQKFHVIDQETIGVLVPYAKGAEFQEQVRNYEIPQSTDGKKQWYRQIQRYSVNLYQNKLKELMEKNALEFYEETGLYLLNKHFYNDSYGVDYGTAIDPSDYIM